MSILLYSRSSYNFVFLDVPPTSSNTTTSNSTVEHSDDSLNCICKPKRVHGLATDFFANLDCQCTKITQTVTLNETRPIIDEEENKNTTKNTNKTGCFVCQHGHRHEHSHNSTHTHEHRHQHGNGTFEHRHSHNHTHEHRHEHGRLPATSTALPEVVPTNNTIVEASTDPEESSEKKEKIEEVEEEVTEEAKDFTEGQKSEHRPHNVTDGDIYSTRGDNQVFSTAGDVVEEVHSTRADLEENSTAGEIIYSTEGDNQVFSTAGDVFESHSTKGDVVEEVRPTTGAPRKRTWRDRFNDLKNKAKRTFG